MYTQVHLPDLCRLLDTIEERTVAGQRLRSAVEKLLMDFVYVLSLDMFSDIKEAVKAAEKAGL